MNKMIEQLTREVPQTDTAVIFVDEQNDFGDENGKLAVKNGGEVVAPSNRMHRMAIESGWLRIYGRDWHPKNSVHFIEFGGPWPTHCEQETWGAEFLPGLQFKEDELGLIISKGMDPLNPISYSEFLGFTNDGRKLEQVLRSHGVRRVVVFGLATDYCVKETAKDAAGLGFLTYVLTDAVRAVNLNLDKQGNPRLEGPTDEEIAFSEMYKAGVIRMTTEHIAREWA